MKMKSLVITIYYSVVNYMSNFAHTAHHARKITLSGKYNNYKVIYLLLIITIVIQYEFVIETYSSDLSEVDTRYW